MFYQSLKLGFNRINVETSKIQPLKMQETCVVQTPRLNTICFFVHMSSIFCIAQCTPSGNVIVVVMAIYKILIFNTGNNRGRQAEGHPK